MYQNYNYYPQQQTQQNLQTVNPQYLAYQRQVPSQISLKGRPVSSLEEARATSIDFDGSIFYFPDLASKRIYTKQINPDGTATLCMYELKELPIKKEGLELPSVDLFVTKEEFQRVLEELRESLIAKQAAPAPVRAQEVYSF